MANRKRIPAWAYFLGFLAVVGIVLVIVLWPKSAVPENSTGESSETVNTLKLPAPSAAESALAINSMKTSAEKLASIEAKIGVEKTTYDDAKAEIEALIESVEGGAKIYYAIDYARMVFSRENDLEKAVGIITKYEDLLTNNLLQLDYYIGLKNLYYLAGNNEKVAEYDNLINTLNLPPEGRTEADLPSSDAVDMTPTANPATDLEIDTTPIDPEEAE